MFTGIVIDRGTLCEVQYAGIEIQSRFMDLKAGESIAVDGICLTVTRPVAGKFRCDISPETMKLTIVNSYREGQAVNLERSLRLSDRLGGHWVTGHIDQKCWVRKRFQDNSYIQIFFDGIIPSHMRYVLKKGSVAVNGVSLTVNSTLEQGFEVMLIPHTSERTNLGELKEGDEVNVEFDWMTKVILSELKMRENRLLS